MGDYRMLLPKGVKRIDQVPWFLHEAIAHGLTVLSWFENFVEAELPPENLWDNAEAIDQHFKRVREKKNAEMNGDGGSSLDDGSPDLMQNELSSVFK